MSNVQRIGARVLRRKPIDQLTHPGSELRRTMGVGHLTMISIGATLGTGGKVAIYDQAGGHLVADVAGWFTR